MADAQMGPINLRFVDKRRGRTHDGVSLAEQNNFDEISTLKSRLNTLAPTKYTTARMHNMTVNDLVYALRLESTDSAGIK